MTDSYRCLAGKGCRNADIKDGQRLGAYTTECDTLCDRCYPHIESAIKQLPADYAALQVALGDKRSGALEVVDSTPGRPVPIEVGREALMASVVYMSDLAADLVAARMNMDRTPRKGEHILTAAIRVVAPNLDVLARVPLEPVILWDKSNEGDYGQPPTTWEKVGERRYIPVDGHGRVLTSMSGVDVAMELLNLHNQTRADLGKTKLRHKYSLPCPRCGCDVGRDDGTTIVDCKSCESSWTEREFKFLVGLVAEDKERHIMKWLLEEAYTRLDSIRRLIHTMTEDDTIKLAGAGPIILDELTKRIAGHPTPQQRAVATADSKATTARQADEDKWDWAGDRPYRRPRRRRKHAKPTPKEPVTASSRILMTEDPTYLGEPEDTTRKCAECNEIHRGDCA